MAGLRPSQEAKPTLNALRLCYHVYHRITESQNHAKQPQLPQPLLIRLVLQTLHQLRCPSLDTLQHLNVSLVVGGPKLNTVFELWHREQQCVTRGQEGWQQSWNSSGQLRVCDTSGKVWTKEKVQVREHLNRLDLHKSMQPDGVYSQVLREMANIIARPLSTMKGHGEVPEHWKGANITFIFKNGKEDPGNYKPDGLTSVMGKVIGQILPEVLYMKMKVRKVIWHGFMKGKSCLTNLIALYNSKTSLVMTVNAVYLYFIMAL
ncbi:LOW QUALITY PROTEIN: hypothetical protein QYF61_013271 [Mycteria americana]|uniref:Uncharacterized protein n=1 Tax=Mycteria americana TaxID=33587 RepID=A0AAN7NSW9_MYCAM|nr:LOW QUALITY PROTEIN: hypothetical protein QYF61_013271 [Mycteria americana]